LLLPVAERGEVACDERVSARRAGGEKSPLALPYVRRANVAV
jgi:hypothetical protein